jgi:hypothetical protein
MIEALKGSGVPCFRVTCDSCGVNDVVAADPANRHRKSGAISPAPAMRKVVQRGWVEVKGRLRCPTCEAKRRAGVAAAAPAAKSEEIAMTKQVTPLRVPSREQRREIVQMLELAYDVAGERYRGTDTRSRSMPNSTAIPILPFTTGPTRALTSAISPQTRCAAWRWI